MLVSCKIPAYYIKIAVKSVQIKMKYGREQVVGCIGNSMYGLNGRFGVKCKCSLFRM